MNKETQIEVESELLNLYKNVRNIETLAEQNIEFYPSDIKTLIITSDLLQSIVSELKTKYFINLK